MTINLHEWAYATAYVTFGVGILSSIARFCCRGLALGLWGWDDTASCMVMAVSIIHQVVLQLFLSLGCGKPGNEDCSFKSLDLLRTAFIEEIVIYGAHSVIKVTFLLFYLRLSAERKFRTFVYVGFALIFCVFLSSLLMTVLQCIPFEKILNPALHPEVKCIDARTIMLTPPVLNIFTDFYIIFLPMPTIWYLQMNRRRKATVITVLAFGVLSTTAAILRLPVLISVTSMKTDASIDVGKVIMVASFEVQCAIIAVNLPATKSLWTKIRGQYNPEDSDNFQEPFGLSPVGRKRRGDTNRTSTMGTVTRLERGLTASESKEELFQEPDRQARWTTRSVACSVSGDGELKRKQSICVTTSVDIEHSPRVSSQQEPLPPPLPHAPLPHTV